MDSVFCSALLQKMIWARINRYSVHFRLYTVHPLPVIKLSPSGNIQINAALECLLSYDCANVCGGDAKLDICGVCNGSGIAEGACNCDGDIKDECGVCGGSGAIYECGCEGMAEGACNCDGDTDISICSPYKIVDYIFVTIGVLLFTLVFL